ncbi:MAG: tetratricopeptide repeat protein [Thermoanaerobaculia bacterium]
MIEADRWLEVDRLFAAALDLPPGQRAPWLGDACAGRPGLRQEVERLLAADAREDPFLDRPPGEILAAALGEEPAEGECLGPYRLLRPLGHGGMGTVYLAVKDDAPEERQVAVKILHWGLSAELRHRFLAERQILARLDHPGIARLYTVGGTEDGRPYLVMERIEGEPLDVYCDRHRLTVDRRIALFRKICAAVEHAHRHLLVHRDLKPANILVTPEGEPKLLDFGIAKQLAPAAESGPRTRTGLRVMTPSYASPEQVRGEAVTTASDVYSLGVLLYELLCGRGPYPVPAGAPLYETERAICGHEPERPSEALLRAGPPPPETLAASRRERPATLRRRLAGDLDTIVLKALRKAPAERYESVSRLSSDLELYLQNLPVSARPDTWRYRARKLLRRHRAAAVLGAAVLLLTVGLVASLLVQGRRIARERDKARQTLSFLVDTFKQADPRHLRGERLTAREVLDQGAGRVTRELAGQPEVQSAVMDAIGGVDLGLGRHGQAAPMLEKALDLRRHTLDPSSLDVAQSLRHLAALRVEQSDFADGEKLLRQALAIERRRLGDADVQVAGTLNELGQAIAKKGDFRSAEPLHRQALAIARQAEGPQGPTVAESLLYLARRRDESGDYPAAETLYSQGLALEKQLLGEGNPAFAKFQAAYGSVLMNQGKFKPAEAVFRGSLAIQRQALGEDHPDVAELLNDLAESRHGQGDLQGAETLYRQSLSGLRKSYGEVSGPVGDTLANLGSILEIEGRSAEAVPVHEEALAIRRRIYGDHHQVVGHSLLCLARARLSLGQLDAALPLARQSLSILQATLGPEHPLTGRPSEVVGLVLQDQGKAAAAEPYLRRAVELLSRSVPPGHPKLAETRAELADCLAKLGRLPEAASLLRQAEPVLAAQMGPDAEPVRQIRASLADIERRIRPAGAAPAPPAGPRSARSPG